MADGGSLENTLTQGKIAGIPVWAAGVGMAGLFIAYTYFRNRNSGPPTVSMESPDLLPAASENDGLPDGPIGDWLAQNPTSSAYPVGFTPGALPSPISNAQWVRLVSDELISRGVEPALVANALYKYLSGKPLTEAEQAVINRALTLIGLPPEGIIPINGGAPQPYTLYWLQGKTLWALAGGSERWQETSSQTQANRWATDYMGGPNGHAIGLSKEAWDAKKADALAGRS